MEWTLESAQEHLSTLMDRALNEGPQRLRVGEESVVVLSEYEYKKLQERKPTLKELLLNGPDLTGVDLERNLSPPREFDW